MSRLTDALELKGSILGTLVSVASPSLAEAISLSGLDWLFFDCEHSVLDLSDIQTMVQAMNRTCLSMIRIEEPLPVYVKRALDTGCDAIIVPQVNSVEIAKAVAKAGKYPPSGGRSVGLGRALGYGATLADGIKNENARTSIIVQIEHIDAVACVEQILAVDGVDGAIAGAYDLSGSLGIPGDIADERVQAAIAKT
jgi:2-keto-3-deoxy-L-rhamnonate aldolase RhmA